MRRPDDFGTLYAFFGEQEGLHYAEALRRSGLRPDIFRARVDKLVLGGALKRGSGGVKLTEAGAAALREGIARGWRPARPTRFLRSDNLDLDQGPRHASP